MLYITSNLIQIIKRIINELINIYIYYSKLSLEISETLNSQMTIILLIKKKDRYL